MLVVSTVILSNLFNLKGCCPCVEFMLHILTLGTKFCEAIGRVTKLIGSNKLRVVTVIATGNLIVFLGKLCVNYQPKTPTLEFVLVQVVDFKTNTPIPPYP